MVPLEFVVPDRPISQQVRRRARLREWQELVVAHARQAVGPEPSLASEPVALRILYLCDQNPLDVDNLLKPIQDALVGVVFDDDDVITDVEIRRRSIQTKFELRAPSRALLTALMLRRDCVVISIADAPAQNVLP